MLSIIMLKTTQLNILNILVSGIVIFKTYENISILNI
jgi:hypothetical protein